MDYERTQKLKYTLKSKLANYLRGTYPIPAMKIQYFIKFHKRLNLNNPCTLNEKIAWLKAYDLPNNFEKGKAADKSYLPIFLSEKGLGEYSPPIFQIADKPEDILFDELPNKFVVKLSNGSGHNIIVTDKNSISIEEFYQKLDDIFFVRYGYNSGERHYLLTPNRLVVEKYVDQLSIDFKIFFINGEAKMYMFQEWDKTNSSLYVGHEDSFILFGDPYTGEIWQVDKTLGGKTNRVEGEIVDFPEEWAKMLQVGERLSEPFDLVRIDFYFENKKLRVGELTFAPGGGVRVFNEFIENKLGKELRIHT